MPDLAPVTCDLCDAHKGDRSGAFSVLPPVFRDFGARSAFHGPVSTAKCFENNSLVKAAVESPGQGRVLVVDGAWEFETASWAAEPPKSRLRGRPMPVRRAWNWRLGRCLAPTRTAPDVSPGTRSASISGLTRSSSASSPRAAQRHPGCRQAALPVLSA